MQTRSKAQQSKEQQSSQQIREEFYQKHLKKKKVEQMQFVQPQQIQQAIIQQKINFNKPWTLPTPEVIQRQNNALSKQKKQQSMIEKIESLSGSQQNVLANRDVQRQIISNLVNDPEINPGRLSLDVLNNYIQFQAPQTLQKMKETKAKRDIKKAANFLIKKQEMEKQGTINSVYGLDMSTAGEYAKQLGYPATVVNDHISSYQLNKTGDGYKLFTKALFKGSNLQSHPALKYLISMNKMLQAKKAFEKWQAKSDTESDRTKDPQRVASKLVNTARRYLLQFYIPPQGLTNEFAATKIGQRVLAKRQKIRDFIQQYAQQVQQVPIQQQQVQQQSQQFELEQ